MRPLLRGRRARESQVHHPLTPGSTSTTVIPGFSIGRAIGVTPAVLRLTPGAVNRKRRAPSPRIPLEPDPEVRRRRSRWRTAPGAFHGLRPQRREVAAPLTSRPPAAPPIRARAIGHARRNPPGMPVDDTFRSRLPSRQWDLSRLRRVSASLPMIGSELIGAEMSSEGQNDDVQTTDFRPDGR